MRGVMMGRKIVQKNNIEKIAGFRSHGSAVAAAIGLLTKRHATRRLYGSFLINEIKKPKWKLFLQHPLEYLSFALPGGTLFITNDGTKGDIVFNKIGSKNVDFKFLLNGINKEIEQNLDAPEVNLPSPFMSYVARIADWKRQHLLVEALKILTDKNVDFPKCLIVGPVTHPEYHSNLMAKIKDYKLEDKVQVIEGLPSAQGHYLLKHSLLSFSLYHTSNLGNVFLETISLGTPMIAINDTGSLNRFPKDIYLEVGESSPAAVAEVLINALNNPKHLELVAANAKAYSTENFYSWKHRASKEVNILFN